MPGGLEAARAFDVETPAGPNSGLVKAGASLGSGRWWRGSHVINIKLASPSGHQDDLSTLSAGTTVQYFT